MKKSAVEKWLQRVHPKSSRSDDYSADLKEWIRQVISEAERNGDTNRKNLFLALIAELAGNCSLQMHYSAPAP